MPLLLRTRPWCRQTAYLSFVVCGDSSHVVVNCGQDGDGLFGDVHSSKDHRRLRDPGQPCGQLLRRQVVKLQVHVVLLWTDTPKTNETSRVKSVPPSNACQTPPSSVPALPDLYGHGAGHHVSGGQVFGVGSVALHEALSLTVDQDSSFTTAAFCDQATGSVDPC